MSVPVVDAPALAAAGPVTPGQLLSARERGAVRFREKVTRELSGAAGPKRSADHLLGYRHGWDEAVAFLQAQGAVR